MSWEFMDINYKTEEYKALLTYLLGIMPNKRIRISFRHCKDTGYKVMNVAYHDSDHPNKNLANLVSYYVINLKIMKPTLNSLCQTPVSSELRELINKVLYPEHPALEMMVQNIYDPDSQDLLDTWKRFMGLEYYIN